MSKSTIVSIRNGYRPRAAICCSAPTYAKINLEAGHLGAFLGASAPVYVNGFAQAALGLGLSDFTDTDFLEINLSLHGTFSNGGATASLYVDTGDSFSTYQMSCGPYYSRTTVDPARRMEPSRPSFLSRMWTL
jgi:hypothetical protein